MRVESQHAGPPAVRTGNLHNTPQNVPVPAVDAIEVANGQRRRTKRAGRLGKTAIDLHRAPSTSISRPSYASRILGGSRSSVLAWPRSWQMWVKNARFGCSDSTV